MNTKLTRTGVALVCGALALGAISASAEENPYPSLPGAPEPQAASATYLGTEEALNLALDWAKFGKEPDTTKMIDAAITAISIGYPPAGAVLGVAKGFIMGLAAGPDPVFEALKVMDKRITALENNIRLLEQGLLAVRDAHFNLENRIRIGELQRRRDDLRDLRNAIAERPTSPAAKKRVTEKAAALAARFLYANSFDVDMWNWSDLRVYRDPQSKEMKTALMTPDFKTLPMLEAYVNAVILLMVAIEYESGGNTTFVKQNYTKELLRHAQFLSVRPWWQEGMEQPETLPEQVMARVDCEVLPGTYQDEQGYCYVGGARCNDTLARRVTYGDAPVPSIKLPPGSTRCIMPIHEPQRMSAASRADLEAHPIYGSHAMGRLRQHLQRTVPVEDAIEEFHGLETMTVLADRIEKLASTGSLTPPFVGRFDMTFWTRQTLYAVKPNGELLWFGHKVGFDRNPPQPGLAKRYETNPRAVVVQPAAGTTANAQARAKARVSPSTTVAGAISRERALTPQTAATIPAAGSVVAAGAPQEKIIHQLEGPKGIGTGWQSFRDIIPGSVSSNGAVSSASFYGLTADGILKWYRHDGLMTGESKWKGPVDVHTGWNGFRKVVSGGDGVLYGIGADGSLRWYRELDVADASAQPKWAGPAVVGSGWGGFVHVFSTGQGVIYGVDPDGKLWWYKHKGYLTGAPDWEPRKQVGHGWAGFTKVFSPGDGYIYALQPNGDLLWYLHDGFRDGTVRWRGPTPIAAAWGNFPIVFPAVSGTPQGPVVR